MIHTSQTCILQILEKGKLHVLQTEQEEEECERIGSFPMPKEVGINKSTRKEVQLNGRMI